MDRGEAYGWGCFVRKMQRGFTLIEILAVVTILAIAAVCAIPMVSNGFADVKLTAAARSVMADLFYAQNYAITTQQSVYIAVSTSTTGGKYQMYYSDTTVTPSVWTMMVRPGGGTFTVNLGAVSGTVTGTTLADATLASVLVAAAVPTANNVSVTVPAPTVTINQPTIGFDTLGQPFNGTPTTPAAGVTTVQLKSRDGKMTTTLSIEAFTGEITVQ